MRTGRAGTARRIRRGPWLVFALVLLACPARELDPLNPCLQVVRQPQDRHDFIPEIDVLVVVDNGPGMAEAQAALAAELPRFVETLATGVRRDRESGVVLDRFPAPRSVRLGVITTDMGTGGFSVPTCDEPRFGDDGLLLTEGNPEADPRCAASYPAFVSFERDPTESNEDAARRAAALGFGVGCVAQPGTGGCAFGQPLDAMLKAVTPPNSGFTFQEGTPGNGPANSIPGSGYPDDDSDDRFVRQNSLLVVLTLTGDDDCSTFEPDLFNPASTRFTGDLNLRCSRFPEAVYPVSRFGDGLLALRAYNPSRLLYAPIVGVPPDLLASPLPPDFDALLEDPRMQEAPAPDGRSLRAACESAAFGPARPARRFVRLAQELEARDAAASLQSLCAESLGPAVDRILERVVVRLSGGDCLPRALQRLPTGLVACELTEILPAPGSDRPSACAAVPGRRRIRVVVDEATGFQREVCRVQQLTREAFERSERGESAEQGWVYDDFHRLDPATGAPRGCSRDRPQRVSFTREGGLVEGSVVRFGCVDVVPPASPRAAITLGDSCFESPTVEARDDFCNRATTAPSAAEGLNERLRDRLPEGGRLFCEPLSMSCQIACVTDADCPAELSCLEVQVPPTVERPSSPGVCLDPMCPSFPLG